MDALGWQALLAAELVPAKGLALLEELGALSCGWSDAIERSPLLSEAERKRANFLSPSRIEQVLAQGVRAVPRSEFPPQMERCHYPPAAFVWGDFGCAFEPSIAIVGTRAATTYGKAAAMKFAEAFARAGVTVISGGALGIDAAAHQGALAQDGKTIAVMAGGIE